GVEGPREGQRGVAGDVVRLEEATQVLVGHALDALEVARDGPAEGMVREEQPPRDVVDAEIAAFLVEVAEELLAEDALLDVEPLEARRVKDAAPRLEARLERLGREAQLVLDQVDVR